MTTVAQVIDRIYRDYLTPPGEQPTQFKVGAGGIDTSSTTLPVDTSMLGAEEAGAIGVGATVEGETGELFKVEEVAGDPPTSLEVRREMYDTDALALTAGDYLNLAHEDYKPRKTVFDAVADSITALYPDLYTIEVGEVYASEAPVELPPDVGEVFQVLYQSGPRWPPLHAWRELRNFPLVSTGRALEVRRVTGIIQVYYKKAPTRPSSEADELVADLGVSESWVKPVMVGAVAQVVANKDIDRSTIDFITEALEAQGFEIGAGADIRNSLLQFRDFLIRPLKDRLALEIDDRVVHVKGH